MEKLLDETPSLAVLNTIPVGSRHGKGRRGNGRCSRADGVGADEWMSSSTTPEGKGGTGSVWLGHLG